MTNQNYEKIRDLLISYGAKIPSKKEWGLIRKTYREWTEDETLSPDAIRDTDILYSSGRILIGEFEEFDSGWGIIEVHDYFFLILKISSQLEPERITFKEKRLYVYFTCVCQISQTWIEISKSNYEFLQLTLL